MSSTAYEQRVHHYLANHPGATLAEARGHPILSPGPEASSLETLKYKMSVISSRAQAASRLGFITPDAAKQVAKNSREIVKIYKNEVRTQPVRSEKFRAAQYKIKRLRDEIEDYDVTAQYDNSDFWYH